MGNVVMIQKEEGFATVTINNPPVNVLSAAVVTELNEVFSLIEEDPEVIVVIVTGAGSKAFMAGADIKEFPEWIGTEQARDIAMRSHKVFNKINFLPKPTIALLNGITFGGGCELALACDLRIAEAHAQIGLPEVKLGVFPGAGGTQRLPRLIGPAKAKELMLTGEPISAETAEKIGLVNQVVPSGEGMEVARNLAKKISGFSLEALSRIKQCVDEGADLSFHAAIEREADLFYEVFQTEDAREGVQAFIEKRPPQFKHK